MTLTPGGTLPPLEVLVVEDSPTQAEHLGSILAAQGYRVIRARNGREALDVLTAHRPDLVISDIQMPDLDGYELCRRIKAHPATAQIPVILLTTLADPDAMVKGVQCGADNFITKPYRDGLLLPRIQFTLARASLKAGRAGH